MKISVVTVSNVLQDLKLVGETFTSVGKRYGITSTTAAAIFDSHVFISRKVLPPFLCIDECYAFSGDDGNYVCVLIDFVTKITIDLLPSRKIEDLIKYFDLIPLEERKKVQITGCKDIWIELGLQTIHDQIARDFNRGYDFDVFVDTVKRLAKTKIKVCVHLINGLPNESMEMMVESAKVVSSMDIDAVKIHMLHLVKDSRLGQQYLKKPFKILSKDEYVDIVASQLEVIPKEIIIQRLTGDAKAENLIVPKWTLSKFIVMNDIQKELVKRDSYQGRLA